MRVTCCICSDILDEVTSTSVASCGHVFHSNCITLWISNSGTCPVCRKRVNHRNITRLYFTLPTSNEVENPSVLENEILDLKAQLSARDIELQKLQKQKEDTAAYAKEAEKRASDLQQAVYKNESVITKLRLDLKSLNGLQARNLKLEQMNSSLNNDLQLLNNVQLIVNGTQKDIDVLIQECGDASEATKQMATYCTVLKRELQNVIDSKRKLREEQAKLKEENCCYAAKIKFYEEALAINSKSSAIPTDPCTSGIKNQLCNKQDNKFYSPITSKLLKQSNQAEVDISPLSVPFKKSNFNLHIVAPSKTSYKTGESNSETKAKHTALTSNTNFNDNSSVIRTGYNGLGGHSNFINTSSSIKRFKGLKKK